MRVFWITTAVALAMAVFSSAAQDEIKGDASLYTRPPVPAGARNPAGAVVIRYDDEVLRREAGPHDGGGETTASRYFDDVPDAGLIFRRRSLHPGSAIGKHVLRHDEVYFILGGRGELSVNDLQAEVVAGAAIFLRRGADVGIRPLGDADLVILIAYPPFEE